jgi:hypothetical protein
MIAFALIAAAAAVLMATSWVITWLEELGHWDDDDPVACECVAAVPDGIGECRRCHRLVVEEAS